MRSSGKIFFLTFLMLGGLAVGGYLWCIPDLDGALSIATEPPKANASVPPGAAACAIPQAEVPNEPESAPVCSVEVTDITGQGDTLYSVLEYHISKPEWVEKAAHSLASVIRSGLDPKFTPHRPLKPGARYTITLDSEGGFLKAGIDMDVAHVFHATADGNQVRAWKEEVVLEFKPETVSFDIAGNLTESLLKTGEGMELALKLTNVFRWDIDFQSESMRGDVCKILFERRYADDRPSGYGRILCAVYQGRKTGKKVAVLFNGTYYDENGRELKKNFLRSPLSVLRVTSQYGRRFHPILRVWRKHNGVDYGAPKGTPVWSVARGVVTFAGWKKGYGKYVCITHENGFESRYGHLSRILVKKGRRVKQRQRIGLVGATGLATGPHLDFQLLVKGKHVDPLKVKMITALRHVPKPLQSRFRRVAGARLIKLGDMVLVKDSSTERSTLR